MNLRLLRDRIGGNSPAVTNMEHFFDLVSVFAVTQLSHELLTHRTLRGALETLVLLLGVWWAWVLTAWAHEYPSDGEETIEHTREATRLGRNSFAYAHGVMVAGIIVVAVAIDFTMEHPDGAVGSAKGLTLLGGPALYLASNALVKFMLTSRIPGPRLLGIAALAVISPLAWLVSPLALAGMAMVITLAPAALTGSSHRENARVASPSF